MSRAKEFPFTVVSMAQAAEGIFCARIATPVARELAPGQFVNLAVPGDGSHLLRLPLSFSSCDPSTLTVELCFAVVGEGTERLSRMSAGQTSVLTGPLGHGWEMPAGAGRALLIAGGIGLPPVVAAARMLAEAGVSFDVAIGAQSASRHVTGLIEEMQSLTPAPMETPSGRPEVILCTDDGTLGIHGTTLAVMHNLLAERRYACCYACGPEGMLRAVAELAEKVGMDCQVSLERMMGCGFGACSCCNVALRRGGYAQCCVTGPVFDAKEVAW